MRQWFQAMFLFCACGACIAAEPSSSGRFSIDVWDTDSGLPQNSVISMVRTRDGYLWLGTVNGLVRFDGIGRRIGGAIGTEFPVFDERNTPGLDSSLIVKLFEDSHGNLWIGTETAGIVRVREGRIDRIALGNGTRESRLLSICEDKTGAVWLYTADGQLGRYSSGRLDKWQSGTQLPSRSRHLIVDASGLLWVGTDRSLVALQPVDGTTNAAIVVAHEIPVGKLDYLLASSGGGYWRLANGRIQKWNRDKLERDLGAYPWNIWATPVYAACEDRAGNLVVGTGGEGLFWFDAQGGYTRLSVTNGLSYNTVLSLLADQEGNLWVGTDGGGLDRVRPQMFKLLEASKDLVVRSVCEAPDGGVWVGYNMGRIDFWKPGEFASYTNTQGLIDLNVRSLLVDDSGRLWVGTLGRGLLRFADGLFLAVNDASFLRRDREVCVLFEDASKRLWVGSAEGLACRDNGAWKLYSTRDGLGANDIRAVTQDRQGQIWVGTQGGGLSFFKDNRFVSAATLAHTGSSTNAEPFPAGTVSCLLSDHDGVLWAGTSMGLVRYGGGGWTFYTNQLGLSLGSIGYLAEDDEGFLWLGSNRGLMRAPKAALNAYAKTGSGDLPVRFFGKADGLPTREASQGSQPAAWRSSSGTLWFPTIKGLVSVNPRLIARNTNPPPVMIEAVAIDGRMAGSLGLRARRPEKVQVPAGKESLDIYFTSLNLSAPDQGYFRYQMEGFESGSNLLPGTIRSVHYPRLPHGSYTFRVTACNEDGVWNPVGSALAITVLPPFWQTRWFLTLSIVFVLAVVAGFVYLVSTQRLQRQLLVLRQHEVLEKERARIARDLHDQLGANLTQVALLGELAETDKDEPGEVESHARQICQTARETTRALDEIVWTVNPSNDTVEGLGNYLCKYAQDYLSTAEIRCRLEVPAQLPAMPISPELRHNVFLVAKEALNNVVKHSGADEARLRLGVEGERFRVEIEDNGRGLPDNAENKGRNGLKNMRRRMVEVGGNFEVVSASPHGTLVRLSAPLRSAHAL